MRPKIFQSRPGDGSLASALCTIALILGMMDTVGWVALTAMSLLGPEDIALRSLGIRLMWLILGLFLLTGLPGLVLAYSNRAPRLSLIFTGAFPVLFMIMYATITIVFT